MPPQGPTSSGPTSSGPTGSGSAGSGPDGPDHPPQGGAGRGGPSDDQPELQLKKLSPTGLVASGGAAATASVIGGQLGIAGTVIGAALTSVVSATALAVYTDSVNRSKATLKAVAEKTQVAPPARRAPRTTHGKSTSRTAARAQDPAEPAGRETRDGAEGRADAQTPGRRRILRTVILAVVIALIGIAAVFGIQRVTGVELSPGTGEIQRSVTGNESIAPRGDSSPTDQEQQDRDGVDPQQRDGSERDTEAPQQEEGPAEDQGDAPASEAPAPAEQDSGTGGGDGGSTGEQGSGTSGE